MSVNNSNILKRVSFGTKPSQTNNNNNNNNDDIGPDIQKRRAELAKVMKKLKVPSENKKSKLLLKAAAEGRVTDIVSLHRGTKLLDLDCKDGDGNSPLLWCAMKGHNDCMDYLLSHGANIMSENPLGHNALHLAILYGYPELIATLQHYGISLDREDKQGLAPLLLAVQIGSEKSTKMLIDLGCNFQLPAPKGRDGHILFEAARRGWHKVIEALCHQNVDLTLADSAGDSVLHHAAKTGNLKLITSILKFAPLHQKNRKGLYPYQVAEKHDHIEAAKQIKDHQEHQEKETGYNTTRAKNIQKLKNSKNRDTHQISATLGISLNGKNWSIRWVEVKDLDFVEFDKKGGTPLRQTKLLNVVISEYTKTKYPNCVSMSTASKKLIIRFETAKQKQEWIQLLKRPIGKPADDDNNNEKMDKKLILDLDSDPDVPPEKHTFNFEESALKGRDWKEVATNLADFLSDRGFENEWIKLEEFEISKGVPALCSEAMEPINAVKNRYTNVVPYNTNRVKIREYEEIGISNYINASPITAGSLKYIATQAPMPNSFEDFWVMIWEQNSRLILMFTKFAEDRRQKADDYFPQEDSPDKYEDTGIIVKQKKIFFFQDLTVRTLQLRRGDKKKNITHYHYLGWPDHGVPNPASLFRMRERILEDMRENKKLSKYPIVIHCSAGIGRTGTWIALNQLIEQYNNAVEKGEVVPLNIMKTIADMRYQRSAMLTSIHQYEFLYRCLFREISLKFEPDQPETNMKFDDESSEASEVKYRTLPPKFEIPSHNRTDSDDDSVEIVFPDNADEKSPTIISSSLPASSLSPQHAPPLTNTLPTLSSSSSRAFNVIDETVSHEQLELNVN